MFELTDKEVSNLHNAKCYLLYALEHAREMYKPDSDFVRNLERSMGYLEPVASRVMKIKDAIHEDRWERAQRIAQLNGFDNSIWSMYEIESFDSKSGIPVGSKIRSWYSGKDFEVSVEGPTWLDVWKATDTLIRSTRDIHGDHVFIEHYAKVKGLDNVYEVSLGS